MQLLLLRHAKSSRDDPALADIDRPLAQRGVEAAAYMGAAMAAAGRTPARILCSPARRTRETLLGVLQQLLPRMPEEANISLNPGLYTGTHQSYLNLVRAHGATAPLLLVIGHNPSIQEFAVEVIGSGDLKQVVSTKFPTGALSVIDFAIERWSDLQPGTGHITDFVEPQD